MRNFLLVLTILSLFGGAKAQKVRLGLNASPLMSWMKGEGDLTSDGMQVSYSFGLMLDYNFTPNYALASGFFV